MGGVVDAAAARALTWSDLTADQQHGVVDAVYLAAGARYYVLPYNDSAALGIGWALSSRWQSPSAADDTPDLGHAELYAFIDSGMASVNDSGTAPITFPGASADQLATDLLPAEYLVPGLRGSNPGAPQSAEAILAIVPGTQWWLSGGRRLVVSVDTPPVSYPFALGGLALCSNDPIQRGLLWSTTGDPYPTAGAFVPWDPSSNPCASDYLGPNPPTIADGLYDCVTNYYWTVGATGGSVGVAGPGLEGSSVAQDKCTGSGWNPVANTGWDSPVRLPPGRWLVADEYLASGTDPGWWYTSGSLTGCGISLIPLPSNVFTPLSGPEETCFGLPLDQSAAQASVEPESDATWQGAFSSEASPQSPPSGIPVSFLQWSLNPPSADQVSSTMQDVMDAGDAPAEAIDAVVAEATANPDVQVPDCYSGLYSACAAQLAATGLQAQKLSSDDPVCDCSAATDPVDDVEGMSLDNTNYTEAGGEWVSPGTIVYVYANPSVGQVTAPDCTGLTVLGCETAFSEAGFTASPTVTWVNSPTTPVGNVASTTPSAGNTFAPQDAGTQVAISGSGAIVPDCGSGSQDYQACADAMTQLGLTPVQQECSYSSDGSWNEPDSSNNGDSCGYLSDPVGSVEGTDPSAPAAVAPGTTVNLYLNTESDLQKVLDDPNSNAVTTGGETTSDILNDCAGGAVLWHYTDSDAADSIFTNAFLIASDADSPYPSGAFATTIPPDASGWTQFTLSLHLFPRYKPVDHWVLFCTAIGTAAWTNPVPGALAGDPPDGENDYWYVPANPSDDVSVHPEAWGITTMPPS